MKVLISVSNKAGLVELGAELVAMGHEIISTGGTAGTLQAAGVPVTAVHSLTDFPEIMDGRVKTLHPIVHGGILGVRENPTHQAQMKEHGIQPIDLVVVNLYPFENTVARPDVTREEAIENIDIGGPAMVRSAAKNHAFVTVVVDPKDYPAILECLRTTGSVPLEMRKRLAYKAFFHTACYDAAIASYLSGGEYFGFFGTRVDTCLYGENRWQTPANLYSTGTTDPLALDKFSLVAGKALSFINWTDLDRLLQTATHIASTHEVNGVSGMLIAVGVKHGNACGAAVGTDPAVVLEKMMTGDPLAIMGGLLMVNFPITEGLCGALVDRKLDGIVAPDFTPEAIEILRRRGDKCRFVVNPALSELSNLDRSIRFRHVRGGFLTQPNYTHIPNLADGATVKIYGELSESQRRALLLVIPICATSNSNTIALANKDGQLIANGTGQQDRVGSAGLVVTRARRSDHDVNGAVGASDSFFPFPDGPQVLIDAGVSVIYTTSGSVNDRATIDLCEQRNVCLVMTPDSIGRGFYGH